MVSSDMEESRELIAEFEQHVRDTWKSLSEKYENELDGMAVIVFEEIGSKLHLDNVDEMLSSEIKWCESMYLAKDDLNGVAMITNDIFQTMFPKEWVVPMHNRMNALVSSIIHDIYTIGTEVSAEEEKNKDAIDAIGFSAWLDEQYEKKTGVTMAEWGRITRKIHNMSTFLRDFSKFMNWTEEK